MIFASFEFLFLFLPIFFVVYYLTPVRLRNWPILILSWAFYAWWRVDFLALLVCVTAFTFLTSRMMVSAGLAARPVSGGCNSGWSATSACSPISNMPISA